MSQVIDFTEEEVLAVLDALRKGASRHESYAKWYANSKTAKIHSRRAALMRQIHHRIQAPSE